MHRGGLLLALLLAAALPTVVRADAPTRFSLAGGCAPCVRRRRLEAKRSRGATYVFAAKGGRVRDVAVAAGFVALEERGARVHGAAVQGEGPPVHAAARGTRLRAREDHEADADRGRGWACVGRGGVPVLPLTKSRRVAAARAGWFCRISV